MRLRKLLVVFLTLVAVWAVVLACAGCSPDTRDSRSRDSLGDPCAIIMPLGVDFRPPC